MDEKPGDQALAPLAPELFPVSDQHPTLCRDYDYKRLGTASLLASLDLQDGHVIAQVHRKHRSREFIELLKEIDAYYPPEAQIRVILHHHSAHISQETRAYLATRPNRFAYVHTPTDGSWLNLVETLFAKMSRTFLKPLRVTSRLVESPSSATGEALRQRIEQGGAEINAHPVAHRWRHFDFAV